MGIGKDLVLSVGAENLEKASEGLLETALDSVLDEGVLRDIPVIGTIVAGAKAFGSVRDYFLCRKVQKFLSEASKLTWAERASVVAELAGSEKQKERLGEIVMDLLDKADLELKPILIGRLFVAVGRGRVPAGDYLRLCSMINGAFVDDLVGLSKSHSADSLSVDRRFAMQANGFLIFGIKNPPNSERSGASVLALAKALYDEPFELIWQLSKDARVILEHCFDPPAPNPLFESVAEY
ncbi:hypothetical protein HDC36_003401 [Xanthomonas sp. JAI131]|uniref:hypothetical protein n=1 Tax=Xanthomonas sp. JAI131 TaxID=2723067 RepID=UPI0015C7D4C3|nr:hypothetical protein [Xanthomonas sp. JAI131]NYF21925.1 hypothetical protein [Xanthomonas sp. JAI131]